MPDHDEDTLAILDTELSKLRETLEVAYATKDSALQNQVMRRVDQNWRDGSRSLKKRR